MKRILIILFLLCIPFTYSLEPYIDQEISIKDNGEAIIQGFTNLDLLQDIHPIDEQIIGSTHELTEKKGKYWLFRYGSTAPVKASFIKIRFPRNAVINYIGSDLKASITTEDNIITVTFSGENKQVDIKIQYSINGSERNFNSWYILIPFMIFLIIIAIIFIQKLRKKGMIDMKKIEAIKPTLNETQIKILNAILEKKGKSTQTAIQYMTGIPKASLSRNIELLAGKEILQKFYNGTSNSLRIHPSLKK